MLRIRIGPCWIDAPVRVIEVIDTSTAAGFTYGTLPGHPESSEEHFLILERRSSGLTLVDNQSRKRVSYGSPRRLPG